MRTMRQGMGALDERSTAGLAAYRNRELELEARGGDITDCAGNHGHAAGNEGSKVAGERKDRMMRLKLELGCTR